MHRPHHAERRAVLDAGEGAGVAVGVEPQSVPGTGAARTAQGVEQIGAACPHGLVGGHVLGQDGQGLGGHGGVALGQAGRDPVDAPGQVHGGGAGVAHPVDRLAHLVGVPALLATLTHGQQDPQRPGGAERGRAPHGQTAHGGDQVVDVGDREMAHDLGQRGLVDDDHRTGERIAARPLPPVDRPHGATLGAGAHPAGRTPPPSAGLAPIPTVRAGGR